MILVVLNLGRNFNLHLIRFIFFDNSIDYVYYYYDLISYLI